MVNSPNLPRRRVPMSALVMQVDICNGVGAPPSPALGADFLSDLHCSPLSWRGGGVSDALSAQMARVALTLPRPILSAARAQDDAARLKKRVVFADDKGLALVQTRLVTEPSYLPPHCALRHLKAAIISPPPVTLSMVRAWKLDFPQPAANYMRFCEQVERSNICLETVTVCRDSKLAGIVQVKNLAFQKHIFVRATNDRWRSCQNYVATYLTPPGGSSAPAALFDRFKFELPTPDTAERIEFCLGFRCSAGEFWDNNSGMNYSVSRERPRKATPVRDAYLADVDNWAYFSSWADFDDDLPFW